MALIRITGPAVEPVLAAEFKSHARIDYDDEDALIEQYIAAARQRLEQRCARVFVEQVWELRTSSFEASIEIPKPPTIDVVQVSYLDTENAEQVVNANLYDLVEGGDLDAATLIWLDSDTIPSALAARPDAARIQFTTGWADADVPFDIKQAILFMAAHLFENRQSVALNPVRQDIVEVPITVDAYIAPYIVPRL